MVCRDPGYRAHVKSDLYATLSFLHRVACFLSFPLFCVGPQLESSCPDKRFKLIGFYPNKLVEGDAVKLQMFNIIWAILIKSYIYY